MKTKYIILLIFVIFTKSAISQNIMGTVYSLSEKKEKEPVVGATVQWLGTTKGTTTDINGKFEISKDEIKDFRVIIKMLGFKTDTIILNAEDKMLTWEMISDAKTLNEYVIYERNTSYISKMDPRNSQMITTGELYKAACCNLSESFETNASVDVVFSDAITGARQIQLLGLSGIYSAIQTENIPSVRGMASTFGLTYIPGSWMQSIQVAKGTASVINGYESITGQINVELKKPSNTDNLFVNLYINNNLRNELNINKKLEINEHLNTLLLLSINSYNKKIDNNTFIHPLTEVKTKGDNFMDIPKSNGINFMNRWDYLIHEKYTTHFGIKFLNEERNGGSMDYDRNTFELDTSLINNGTLPYGFALKTRRYETFWKNGILFKNKPFKSVALILSATNHEQKGYFGINNYFGEERTYYANFLYQSIIGSTDHKFTTGLSYIYDRFSETYNQTLFIYNYQITGDMSDNSLFTVNHDTNTIHIWKRTESVPGAYFEYTYHNDELLTLIAGIRADYHNKYGFFFTPRLNIRYHINHTTTLRASAGMGYRSANVISENLSILASQRMLVFAEDLKQEKAFNIGLNATKEFNLFGKKAEFNIEIYRTQFLYQLIVDVDSMPTTAFFYNLDGISYANNFQAQFNFEPVKNLSVLLAYRINDVKTTISGMLKEKPFTNRYKGLVNLSYLTNKNNWQFDFTAQFNGSSRMPDQSKMPVLLQRASRTPEYIIINAQITKKFNLIEVYLGCENIGNFKQGDPITEFFRPYHTHFDTTMAWGPIIGRVIYAGLRFTLN